ncbi:hypothetical protein GCM10007161_13510 [Ignatzschineria indica]|uniref:Phage tail protein n=1 Tax=Ignatzschineria indica TaxID=472583 RepID=A0A2U2AJQ5_9GAMM|nr:phage tail assembly chaperone family protein, TAC [Ignatzschineria indica]PWD83053.1 phage tail protein [Ignatzschineria indica]GGZ83309.1 hypothetical protein GCM10007161_13510 [Ignatzschineria indica]
MKLEDVLNLGPVRREIEITDEDGKKHTATVFIRPLSFALVMRSEPESDKEATMDLLAERIAYSICNEKGEPIFTKEQIKGTADKSLSADLVFALMAAVNAFNNFSESKGSSEGK